MADDRGECIPELDMNEWLMSDEESKVKFAKMWNAAFCEFGFCTIINHGVPHDIIDNMYSATREFFDLDEQEKMKYNATGVVDPGFHLRGKTSVGATTPDKKSYYDLHDSFVFYGSDDNRETFEPNQAPPKFLSNAQIYWHSLRKLLQTIFEISDLALGIEKGTFASFYHNYGFARNFIRLNDYYPLSSEECSSNIKRRGAHTDIAGFTILRCDEVPGLEVAIGQEEFDQKNVLPTFKKWETVKTRPDGLVINAGDMIRYWTNGYWKSAFHQVIPYPQRRISMVFFTAPGWEARTDMRLPCPECTGDNQYPEVKMTMLEYFTWRKNKFIY